MKVTGSPTLMYFKPSVNVTVSPGLTMLSFISTMTSGYSSGSRAARPRTIPFCFKFGVCNMMNSASSVLLVIVKVTNTVSAPSWSTGPRVTDVLSIWNFPFMMSAE